MIEDEELSAELLERILKPIVTAVDTTRTLEGAFLLAAKNQYDIILLDLRLLDADAQQSIDAIRDLKKLSSAPLLVITGIPDPTLKARCMAAGADGYVPKLEAYCTESKALYLAVFACTMHHCAGRSADFMEKVRILERLVAAA